MKTIPRYWGYAKTKAGILIRRSSPYRQDDAETAAAPFATCRYLGTVGSEFVHPEVRAILDLHDEATKALCSDELILA